MNKEAALQGIEDLIQEGNGVLATEYNSNMGGTYVDSAMYHSWLAKAMAFLKLFLEDDNEFIKGLQKSHRDYYFEASTRVKIIENVKEYIDKDFIKFEEKNKVNVDNALNIIFSHFYKVARQLRCRYDNRETLKIEDEYDVQDLLHALLLLYFDDVRAEEWTPSYAGKSSRMDFLLKNERVVIEVKKTRHGLADKELGDQLIIDVDRYKVHPDCKRLICFVYDVEGRIGNPKGLMADLNNQHEEFVTVIIKPDM